MPQAPRFKLRFDIPRLYLAGAAILSVFHLYRAQVSSTLSPEEIRIATLADIAIVAAGALLFHIVSRLVARDSLSGRCNHLLHQVLALLFMLLACLSQALFVKTGETLNLDMLSFFIAHIGDLHAVASGEFDFELLAIPLLCLGMLMMTSARIRVPAISHLRLLVLLLPFGLVAAGPLLQPPTVSSELDIEPRLTLEIKVLQQGQYQNVFRQHMLWNATNVQHWRRGILTGIPATGYGGTLLQVLAGSDEVDVPYRRPHGVSAKAIRPDVLLIVLESFRRDAVGIHRQTVGKDKTASKTPFLDGIARQGWRAMHAYTTIPHTSKALVGIYCGTFPRTETEILEAIPGNLPLTCLPRLMKEAGYRSAHFQTAIGTFENRVSLLANVGFDEGYTQESLAGETDQWTKLAYLGMDDRAMIDPAVDWMRKRRSRGEPFLTSLLTITTHHPYVTPHRIEAVSNPEQAKMAYDDAVRYTDKWLKELFGKMKRHGLLENTLVVITGDHGEAFAEHGAITHNAIGYEEGIAVPLILSGPMLGAPKEIPGLRQHIDIMPTILDIAGITYSGQLPGISLTGDSPGHADLITTCFYRDYCLTHLSADRKKLIFFYGKRDIEMYDLGIDPDERRNLYSEATREEALRRLGFAAKTKFAYEAVYRAERDTVLAAATFSKGTDE